MALWDKYIPCVYDIAYHKQVWFNILIETYIDEHVVLKVLIELVIVWYMLFLNWDTWSCCQWVPDANWNIYDIYFLASKLHVK